VLLAGVLDGDPETTPFRHIFVSQNAAWNIICDDLPQFEDGPPADQRIEPKLPSN
jgi:hypothetical protein